MSDAKDTHNFKKLKAHILKRSLATNFDDARLEWALDYILVTQNFGKCPCGKEIKEHCYLRNEKTKKETWVGNVCVRKFMDIDAGKLFSGLKRIQKNHSAKPNDGLTEYAWNRGYLYGENEYDFLRSITSHRRKLSERQLHWLQKINRRIVETIVVRELPDMPIVGDETDTDSE